MEEKESFVVYPSFVDTFYHLLQQNRDQALWYAQALFDYGCYGIKPDENDPIIGYLYNAFVLIDQAKKRYRDAKVNGNKGGRPKKNLAEKDIFRSMQKNNTWKSVAEELGVDEDTLRKYRKKLGISGRPGSAGTE